MDAIALFQLLQQGAVHRKRDPRDPGKAQAPEAVGPDRQIEADRNILLLDHPRDPAQLLHDQVEAVDTEHGQVFLPAQAADGDFQVAEGSQKKFELGVIEGCRTDEVGGAVNPEPVTVVPQFQKPLFQEVVREEIRLHGAETDGTSAQSIEVLANFAEQVHVHHAFGPARFVVGAEDTVHRAKIGAFDVYIKRPLFNNRVHMTQGGLIPCLAGDESLDAVCQILQGRLLQTPNRGSFPPRHSCQRRCKKIA